MVSIIYFLRKKLLFIFFVSFFIYCEEEQQEEKQRSEENTKILYKQGEANVPDTINLNEETNTEYSYTIVLESSPQEDVKMDIFIENRSIKNPVISPDSITFNSSNWDTPQSIKITLSDEEIAVRSIILRHQISTQDTYYQAILGRLITLNIENGDPPNVLLSKADNTPFMRSATLIENGEVNYAIAINTVPTANVTITVSLPDPAPNNLRITSGAQSVTGSDASVILTFTSGNWHMAQPIILTLTSDRMDTTYASEGYRISHRVSTTDPEYENIMLNDITLMLEDDTDPGILLNKADNTPFDGTATLMENGETFNYKIVLNTQPTANVIITISLPTSAPDNLGINSGAQSVTGSDASVILTFTSGNWGMAQPITLTLASDSMDTTYASQGYGITHEVSSTDSEYESITLNDITLMLEEESAKVNKSGTFINANGYSVRGSASIIMENEGHYVLLGDDFESGSGGGLNLDVYLTKGPAVRNIQDFINLGDLKSTVGQQSYSIPAAVDISQYTHVVIYCVAVSGAFGIAELNAP